jgi:outer membrane protein assembly complex protein YaeT
VKWQRFYLLGLAVVFAAQAPSAAQEKPREPQKVVQVAFDGLKTIKADTLMGILRTRVGDVYESQSINEDVKRLQQTGYFDWVTAATEALDQGTKVVYHVSERGRIAEIVFTGNRHFDAKKLKSAVEMSEGQYFDSFLFARSADKIADLYRDEGYAFVKVTPRSEPAKEGLKLVWVIVEGPRVRISAVKFKGNDRYRDWTLSGLMQTKAHFLFIYPGTYKPDQLQEDLIKISGYYRDQGYLDARAGASFEYSADNSWMTVTVLIEEGPRYKVGTVRFAGNKIYSGAELASAMKLVANAIFTRDALKKDLESVKDLYGDKGYIDAEINPQVSYRKGTQLVDIALNVEELEMVSLGRIDIAGNWKTRDNVIRRNILLTPGEVYSRRLKRRSTERLMNSQLLRDVNVRDVPTGEAGRRDIIFEVEETETAGIVLGGGVSSNDGLFGTISFYQRNFDLTDVPRTFGDIFTSFAGGGQYFRVEFQPGTQFSNLLLYFNEPSVWDSDYGLSLRLYLTERQRENWQEDRLGATVGVSRRAWENWVFSLAARMENVDVTNVEDEAADDVKAVEGSNAIHALVFTADYDRRDSIFLPTRGYHVRGSYEIASEALGGDWNFNHLDFLASWYTPVYEDSEGLIHVFSLTGQAGLIDEFGNSDFVPIFERYFAGGIGRVRGFRFRRMGPMDGRDNPLGGEALLVGTAEYSAPLFSNNFRGILFCDVGSAYYDVSDVNPADLRVSVGFGFRIIIPQMGPYPISFDFGFPLNAKDTDEKSIFSFNVGLNF